jgi:hypothetical protein
LIKLLNADDYLERTFLERARTAFLDNPGCGWVYGGTTVIESDGQVAKHYPGEPDFGSRPVTSNRVAPHPSWLVARDTYVRVGLYAQDLQLAMDYEWMLRAAGSGYSGLWVPGLDATMGAHGRSERGHYRRDYEKHRVARAHHALTPAHAAALLAYRQARSVYERSLELVGGETLRKLGTRPFQLLRRSGNSEPR